MSVLSNITHPRSILFEERLLPLTRFFANRSPARSVAARTPPADGMAVREVKLFYRQSQWQLPLTQRHHISEIFPSIGVDSLYRHPLA